MGYKNAAPFRMLILLMLAVLLVAGCGGSNSPAPSSQENETTTDASPTGSKGEEYPTRPIRVILVSSPGGGVDTAARQLAPYLEKELGVPLQLENYEGGATAIGNRLIAEAEPDGYTIGVFASPHLEFTILTQDVPYTIDDFTFLARQVFDPGVIRVRNDAPWQSFEELLEYAKAHPKEVKFSVSGRTSSNFFGLKQIEQQAGVEFNIIPYEGGNEARIAVLQGEVDGTHAGVFNSQTIADGTRVLAVHYHENRWPDLTDGAKTVNEIMGWNLPDTGSGYGWSAPAGLKEKYPERYEILVKALERAINNEEFLAQMEKAGQRGQINFLNADDLTEFMHTNMESLQQMIHLLEE